MAVDMGTTQRSVVLASADAALRGRLRDSLVGMRWKVREAGGGAEAMAQLEELRPEALLVDSWLPDLEVGEFAGHIHEMFPGIDLLRVDGDALPGGVKSPRRHELLHALREAQDAPVRTDGPAWASAPVAVPTSVAFRVAALSRVKEIVMEEETSLEELAAAVESQLLPEEPMKDRSSNSSVVAGPMVAIPEMIGASAPMMELARMIRLVAPRSTTVLIEGETGTGKEVVAKAIHRLSARSQKPFTVLNCAAIPEALLEAELFGHTRGAFTGAVTSRTGRIEAANGGTLFLDEIGEMPLPLQAKMLRFLEYGELQRVGDNEVMRVDVRVVAATHQLLEKASAEGKFRLDLYHRLAVFPLEVPALRERVSDIPALTEFFLVEMGKEYPRKRVSREAMEKLQTFEWPGNVRELAHVLERAAILVGDAPEIGPGEIRLRYRG
jgi:DNA-binding NtrC family response regulator